jgi:hypothetical protein
VFEVAAGRLRELTTELVALIPGVFGVLAGRDDPCGDTGVK